MSPSRIVVITLSCAAAYSMLGCGADPPATAAPGIARSAPAVPGAVAFTLSARTTHRLEGSIRIGPQPVTFDVRLGARDVVRAEIKDTLGNVVVSFVRADGSRHVRYNGQPMAVRPDGTVAPESFTKLPQAMRRALGMVPLELACAVPDANPRMMEAAALPYNLLQRSAVPLKAPQDLVHESTCVAPVATSPTGAIAHDVLVRSRLVVAPRRGT